MEYSFIILGRFKAKIPEFIILIIILLSLLELYDASISSKNVRSVVDMVSNVVEKIASNEI